jgi:hypothetical protein
MVESPVLMCFSPEVDILAGVVIGAIGLDALRHVSRRREVALAAIPTTLAIHQLVEAVVWLDLQDRISGDSGSLAVVTYLALAFVVVPILVPAGIIGIEPDPERRRLMVPFLVLGVAVAIVLGQALASGPVHAAIGGRYIAYSADLTFGGLVTTMYVVAACGPLLLSSHRRIAIFGAVNVFIVAVLTWLLSVALISLWCAWAAIGSIVFADHLRRERGHAWRWPNAADRSPLSAG